LSRPSMNADYIGKRSDAFLSVQPGLTDVAADAN
jgi:hypothetical protein